MAIKPPKLFNFMNNRKVKSNFEMLDRNLSDIYKDTYYTSKTDSEDAAAIRSDIEKSVSTIMNNNFGDGTGETGNISKIYEKLASYKSDNSVVDMIKNLNNDSNTQTVISTWIQNKWIKDLDTEIDMVLKYAPKLKEALACKKDCVLSADHFAKDFLSFTNILSKDNEQLFNKRMEELKKVYNLPRKAEEWYDDASTYGEVYVYIVPYKKEFATLLKNKNDSFEYGSIRPLSETTVKFGSSSIRENADILPNEALKYAKENGIDSIKITVNNTGLLESATEGIQNAQSLYESGMFGSSIGKVFNEQYINEAENKDVGKKDRLADKLVPDDLKFDDNNEDYPSEMIINKNLNKNSDERINITVPGCVVKELERSNILPLYVEDICLGYYYIEVEGKLNAFDDFNSFEYAAGLNTVSNNRRLSRNVDKFNTDEQNKLINYISGEVYKMIDAKFINNNQELRKEIYTILKHSDLFNSTTPLQEGHIKVSFLSVDDVEHIYFNMDKETHRGKSDLEYSLFPAKLYACLYITNVLGIVTRGQDKRVYYVKQNVETNISQTMINVMNQIKKSNFGARQMENLGNILNITGKFNDILMPTNSAGEPPITMEVLEGQRFTDNSELMAMLEKMMIDPTEVPYDLIEARQSLDYAIQATMSNSRLMRATYKRQDMYEINLTNIFTKIYNYEYDEHEKIEATLPAPSFLNATNGQQLIEGTANYIDSISNYELADESDEVKAEFKRLAIRYYIPSHLNINAINRLVTEAKINVEKKKSLMAAAGEQ